MTKSILTISPLMLFIGFVVGMIAAYGIALIAATYFNWNLEYGPYPTLKYALMTLTLWAYPYLVGRELSQLSQFGFGKTAHLRILLVVLLAIVTNTLSVYFTEVYGPVQPVIVTTAVANFFCLVAVLAFPARELKSIELKRTARFLEFWRELMLFLLWPFFVWWLQPRLTSIAIGKDAQKG